MPDFSRGSQPFHARFFTAASFLQLFTVTSPIPPSVSSTDSTTVPSVSECAGGNGVRVLGGDRVGRGYDVAKVAAKEEMRVVDCEGGAGGWRAVAVRGRRSVADCMERGCGVEVRVVVEEWLAGGKDVWGGCAVADGRWRMVVALVLLGGSVCKARCCDRSLDRSDAVGCVEWSSYVY